MRAARSLNYNRKLQSVVAERIERAEGRIRGYLLAQGLTTLRLGAFEVAMDEEGAIHLERVPMDDKWQQMPLPERSRDRQPNLVSGGTVTVMASAVEAHGLERREQERSADTEEYQYERAG